MVDLVRFILVVLGLARSTVHYPPVSPSPLVLGIDHAIPDGSGWTRRCSGFVPESVLRSWRRHRSAGISLNPLIYLLGTDPRGERGGERARCSRTTRDCRSRGVLGALPRRPALRRRGALPWPITDTSGLSNDDGVDVRRAGRGRSYRSGHRDRLSSDPSRRDRRQRFTTTASRATVPSTCDECAVRRKSLAEGRTGVSARTTAGTRCHSPKPWRCRSTARPPLARGVVDSATNDSTT